MIKNFYIFFFIACFSSVIFAQNPVENDSLLNQRTNKFIEDHNKQLNIKFDVTNDQVRYFFPYENEKATIKTNLNTSLGFVLSYKFLSVRLGIRPGLSTSEKENKGETDYFRLRLKFLFNHWTHRIEYNYARGFYIDNTNDFGSSSNSDFHIQFPNLTTNIISGSTHYNFNENYSVKAVESNTEIQLKSAGTFVVGINYSFYDVAGSNKVITDINEVLFKPTYNDYRGLSAIINGGYHHTFVLHSFWYINVRANPGIGFDFYENTLNSDTDSIESNDNETFFALSTGAAAGYNGKKYYFGIEYNYNVNSQKFSDDNISLQPIKNNFHVFIGYRFKAPKQVSKPIDLIEEKVPILKDDDGN